MNNLTASHAAYRRGEVLAATPAQLVVMLYDGARRFLRQTVAAKSSVRTRASATANGSSAISTARLTSTRAIYRSVCT
jgi:flagellin-specific chaperone FliS